MEMERKIVLDGNNVLSVAEFLQMPELRDNPIVQRVVQVRNIFIIYIYLYEKRLWIGSEVIQIVQRVVQVTRM